jgi:SNF2 family DNA or RNA helicase
MQNETSPPLPLSPAYSLLAAELQLVAPQVLSHHRQQLELGSGQSTRIDLTIARPESYSVLLPPLQVRTTGCLFPEGQEACRLQSLGRPNSGELSVVGSIAKLANRAGMDGGSIFPVERENGESPTLTRIRPPQDVVKLEDRLYYLLQPPLETLLEMESLCFPFLPFGYQLDGIAFLYPRHEAILADEMGLGKTMQAITALRLLFSQGQIRRTLLVCPKPLISNWQREFTLWAPELPVTIVEGNQSRRHWLWQHATEGVLLANYESLVRDHRQVTAIDPALDVMILDESQRIKNRTGTTNRVICSVPRKRSWALTGTPIENSTEDLVGIFDFVSPGCLRSQMKASTMRTAVDDYVLRRTKDQVLADLPPKLYRDAHVVLTPEQLTSYQLAENEGVVRLKDLQQELTIQHVFELVLRLKQICNFDPLTGASTKFDRLRADLEECVASGRKAIVFSQWVRTIEQLRDGLGEYGPLEYHGKIPFRKRENVIEQFRSDPNHHVLLMSYGAGSVGLNLQFAGYVFLFDRWWNPAVEDQAINRVHRVGTTAPVTITRFLAMGTIEQRIDQVLEEKRELFHSVFDPESKPAKPGSRSSGLSREDILNLFNLKFPAA